MQTFILKDKKKSADHPLVLGENQLYINDFLTKTLYYEAYNLKCVKRIMWQMTIYTLLLFLEVLQ